MKTCTEKQMPPVPVSSREAAERAAALTKEQDVIWESERSFSNLGRKDFESETRNSTDADGRNAAED